ncbi:MAG: hypothetical protein EZS28_013373, partial [Streblomastix strix]
MAMVQFEIVPFVPHT